MCGGRFDAFRRPLRARLHIVSRNSHTDTEVTNHARVAPISTMLVPDAGSLSQTTRAKAARPMLPIAAPAASIPAASLPRSVPLLPARSFFRFSCFSTSVAVAGKIAGNARNRPPISGPKRFAMSPATAVTTPPNTKRTKYSYHRDCPNLDVSNLIFTQLPSAPRTTDRERKPTTIPLPGS